MYLTNKVNIWNKKKKVLIKIYQKIVHPITTTGIARYKPLTVKYKDLYVSVSRINANS